MKSFKKVKNFPEASFGKSQTPNGRFFLDLPYNFFLEIMFKIIFSAVVAVDRDRDEILDRDRVRGTATAF